MDAWLELVELYEYKVRDVLAGQSPLGGPRSLRLLREELLGATLEPALHRRLIEADRRWRAFTRGETLPTPAAELAPALINVAPVSTTPSDWLTPTGSPDAESVAWTDLHLLAWHAQLRRTLLAHGHAWQRERDFSVLRVLYAALENADRTSRGVRPWLSVPAAGDPLISLHDPEVLRRLCFQAADLLITDQGRHLLRGAMSQVREQPFPLDEDQGVLDAQLRAAAHEPLSPQAQAQLSGALRAQRPAPRDPRERPAIRAAAQRLMDVIEELLLGSPPLTPGRVPDAAVLFGTQERTARTTPPPQATELVVNLWGGKRVKWRGHELEWQAVGANWQVRGGGRVGLLRTDLPRTERHATLALHDANLEVFLSGDYALLRLEAPSGRAMDERAALTRLIAAMLNPAGDYAALRLARATTQLMRGTPLDPASLAPASAQTYRAASSGALLDFVRRGAETLMGRYLLQPSAEEIGGEGEAAPIPEMAQAAEVLGLPQALARQLSERLRRAASGGEPLPPPERLARLDLPADGTFASLQLGSAPLTVNLPDRVLTLRTDYEGRLLAVMPGMTALPLSDLLVLHMPGQSVLLVREDQHVAVALERERLLPTAGAAAHRTEGHRDGAD